MHSYNYMYLFFSLHTDFITWRGHLTKIMCTPYETRESWQMAATLHNETIYISEVETKENKEKGKWNVQKRLCATYPVPNIVNAPETFVFFAKMFYFSLKFLYGRVFLVVRRSGRFFSSPV